MDKNLNAEEQALLETLINPQNDERFELDEDIQRHILGMLLTDRYFLVQSKSLVKSTYFVNKYHQDIHKALIAFFDRYNAMPHRFYIQQELVRKAKDDAAKIYYLGELDAILDYYVPGTDYREYLLDEITDFAKTEAMRVAFGECTELILRDRHKKSRETWQRVGEILREAQNVDQDYDIGLDYFRTLDDRYAQEVLEVENAVRFTTGFEDIDNGINGGGLSIGEIGAWMAVPGGGKSLALTKGSVANIKNDKKVLFISLEMDENKVAARFDAQLAKENIGTLVDRKDMVIHAVNEFSSQYEDKQRLIIKQFPGGTVDINVLRAYYLQLKLRGFKPDLVVVDYIGEMKDIPGMAIHDSREHIVQQLRAFGVEEKHCTLTAVQPNRGAKDAQKQNSFIDDAQIGDSYNQWRPLDAFWSINQYQAEKDEGLGRIFVIKHRNGKSKFGFEIGFDYEKDKCLPDGVGSLDMFQISKDMYMQKMNEHRDKDAENTQVDQIPMRKKSMGNVTQDAIDGVLGNNYNGDSKEE